MNNQVDITNLEELPPKLPLLQMFRIGLFQMGLGIMSLLVAGLLNRLMINELTIPATLTAGFIAMPLFVSPSRIWFGQTSDAKTIFGTHRSGYVWIGAVVFAIVGFLTTQVMWELGRSVHEIGWNGITYAWAVFLAVMFALYGMAISFSSTPFAALLVDISDEEERSKLVGIVWSMLMVGIVTGAIAVSKLLPCTGAPPNEISIYANGDRLAQLQKAVNSVFVIVPSAVVALSFAATYGIEQKYSRYKLRVAENHILNGTNAEDKLSLARALKVLTASKQTGLFFSFLLMMTIGIFMQDAIMEPFGGAVFGMSICATTQLNAAFGMGTLIGLSSSGFLIVPKLGKENSTRLGCYLVAASCALLLISGFVQKTWALQVSLALFGFASGITTSGALSLMLDLTAAETAGTFVGAWGLSQAIAKGLATVAGGVVLDIGKKLFSDSNTIAYSFVFVCEAAVMICAVVLLSRVNVQEFRTDAKQAIATVFANEID
ncbi:BCD family MFS transporter [Pseudanabaena sp. UWO310]|uniref:BCD family MFS transporter n=1 Tax=Pseudanabaena sp. UWO310 TaxID=2480795 RepID=UPI00115A2A5E|nr:BCD family MFS transporter [Pseudanabaena sp. UWO310]TYQ28474.1 BCD family MFS transporter [Pseudanabaena sp. UWO310]